MTTRTIRNRIHKDFKLPARKPLKKPLITPRMAQLRLDFCCHYKDWTKKDWQKVMSFDESTILQFASYKPFVRRPHGSSPADSRYLQPTVKHPPSVMVWGCFSSQGRGGLYFLPKGQTMNASRYISVLDDHLQSNFDTMPPFGTERKWHSSEGGIITRICKNSLVM